MCVRLLALSICAIGFAVGPAAAQNSGLRPQLDLNLREGALRAQQQLSDQRQVLDEGRLSALQTQIQVERALDDIRAQSRPAAAPPISAAVKPPVADAGPFVSIPDDRLAASDARVRAAAGERR